MTYSSTIRNLGGSLSQTVNAQPSNTSRRAYSRSPADLAIAANPQCDHRIVGLDKPGAMLSPRYTGITNPANHHECIEYHPQPAGMPNVLYSNKLTSANTLQHNNTESR